MSIVVWLFGFVDPDLLGKIRRSRRSADETIWMSRVGYVECPLPILPNGSGQAVVDHSGCHHSDSGVAMFLVVPGKEVLTERPAVLNTTKPIGKLGAVLQGAKLAF